MSENEVSSTKCIVLRNAYIQNKKECKLEYNSSNMSYVIHKLNAKNRILIPKKDLSFSDGKVEIVIITQMRETIEYGKFIFSF